MESRLGNPEKAFILYTKDDHPRNDERFSNFLEVNDAEFDLDVEGNKIAKDRIEEGNVEDNNWGNKIAKDTTGESNIEQIGWRNKIAKDGIVEDNVEDNC